MFMKIKRHSNVKFARNVLAQNLVGKSIKRNAHENQKIFECEICRKCCSVKSSGTVHDK